MSVSDITDANEARDEGTGRKEYVNSLEKGLMVLKVLANASKGMTLSEVALACGTSRASARRFLLTLDELGFVEQIDKRFELTPKVLTLGGQRFDSGLLWQTAKPLMQALSHELNESCSAGIRDGDEIVYVARVAASRIMSVSLDIGSRLPAISTSMGRVILADISDGCFASFLTKARLDKLTPYTLTDPIELRDAVQKVREDGYSIIDQELELGLRSIAVPVRNAQGRVFAGLNISTQAARVEVRQMTEDFLPPLKETAEKISNLAATV